jgi:Tfp pilus assembly protein PilF
MDEKPFQAKVQSTQRAQRTEIPSAFSLAASSVSRRMSCFHFLTRSCGLGVILILASRLSSLGGLPLASACALAQQTAVPASTQLLPGVAEAVNKGFDLLARRDAAGAEAAFRHALDLQPELEMAHRGLGLALRARGQEEAALHELEVATRLDPSDADAHYALAETAWALSRQSSTSARARGGPVQDYRALAAAEYRKLAALRPQDVSIRESLAELELEAGRKEEALTDAQEAVRHAPDDPAVHVTLGRVYFAEADEEKAAAEYEKAMKLNPKQGQAYLALGQVRFFQRRYTQAAENFQQAIQVSPNLAPAYAGMAQIFLQQGRSAAARNMLEKVVALDPEDWQSQYQLAVLMNAAGEVGGATELLEKVTRLHPDFLPAQEQLIMGWVRRGDLKQASSKVDALIAEQPQAAEGHRLRALILRKQHDLEGALAESAMALGSDPDSASMLALQSIALWELNRKKDALAAFRAAAKLEPKVGTAEVFCRLVVCDARDIGTVSDFLRRNRYVLAPPLEP